MSDKDCVKRGDVREILRDELDDIAAMDEASVDNIVDSIPSVEQSMGAAEYIHTSNRMLKEDYRAWDRLMVFEENDDADKAIAWMEEWAREHPERSEE